jgi:hypothetical protein
MPESALKPFDFLLKATSPDASRAVLIVSWAGHPAAGATAATNPTASSNRTKPTRGDPEAAINKTASHQTSMVSSPATISWACCLGWADRRACDSGRWTHPRRLTAAAITLRPE